MGLAVAVGARQLRRMAFDTDSIVIGAGAVGLATGFALAQTGRQVFVLEQAGWIGDGVSSRNSEVIHGGLYYPTGSLKARLCVEGRRMMYDFLEAHHVRHAKCGKLVVTRGPDEEPRLMEILQQAETNGVEGMTVLSAAEAKAREPELTTHAALLSPESGVMDSHGLMVALQGRIEDAGSAVVLSTPFIGAAPLNGGGFEVRTGGAESTTLTTKELVISAGLSAQAAARMIEGYREDLIPKLHYGKGVYFTLTGKAPFRHLIYPLPIPGALGTHYRRDLGGQAVFGPDLEFVDALDYSVDEARKDSFVETIRHFWKDIRAEDLSPGYAGIRPKLHGPGEPHPDWRIDDAHTHGMEGLVTLFGIESPGLTASLAIGREVAGRV